MSICLEETQWCRRLLPEIFLYLAMIGDQRLTEGKEKDKT
jgi:hypothetical protein